MIEPLCVTLLPLVFLILLFGGGELFRRRNIDMGGEPPIKNRMFYSISKYSILLLWAGMVMQSWGMGLSIIPIPLAMKYIALFLWASGFTLLIIGRLGLGESFRIGSPKELTSLQVNGLFRFSRNPMYLGVYGTLLASVLYTGNPVIFLVAIFVIAVHHQIVLAEEQHLQKVFGEQYIEYCHRVRRYL